MLLTGGDRPSEKLLNKYVTGDACNKWHELGLELLEEKDVNTLRQIREDFKDVKKCCNEMFHLWLEKCTNATWNQLIHALKEVQLNYRANQIEKMMLPVEDTTHALCDNAGI